MFVPGNQPLPPLERFQDLVDEIGERWSAQAEGVHRWLSAWTATHNAHDVDGVLELVDERILWIDPTLSGQELVGRAAFGAMLEFSFRAFPDLQVVRGMPLFDVYSSAIVVPWRLRGTFSGKLARPAVHGVRQAPALRPTGRSIDLRGYDLYELRGGVLRHGEAFCDALTLTRQLGLLDPGGRLARLSMRLRRLTAPLHQSRGRSAQADFGDGRRAPERSGFP